MPERKPHSHSDWSLLLLEQFSGGVIDGGDVVGVNCVPQPEDIRDKT
jgi:hypothetical protein